MVIWAPSLLRFPHPLAKYFGTDLYRTRSNENELQYKYCRKEIEASSKGLGPIEMKVVRIHGRYEETGDTHITNMKISTIYSRLSGSFVMF